MRVRTGATAAAVFCLLLAGTVVIGAGPASAAEPVPAAPGRALSGPLYVEAGTDAAKAAARLRTEGNQEAAALIDQIATQPTAVWLGDWFTPQLLQSVIGRHITAAKAQKATLVFVTYAIPNRDCGGFSSGGHSYEDYLDWNRTIAAALAGTGAVVLVEPDSLSMLTDPRCADTAVRRLPLLRDAVQILEGAGLHTYLDGGNSRWLTPTQQATLLNSAGIAGASGFFTNVAGYNSVADERNYAGKVSARVGLKHYVIDTSRNGRTIAGGWCNVAGAGLGANPRATPNDGKLDALLWVKHPGASDGACNGGPAAGKWFEQYALDLVLNR